MELEKIYLRRNETGKGFGQVSLRMVFDLGLQKLKNIVWLKAMDSSLAAIGFYQRAGFDFCGTHRLDYPLMKEQFRGMVIMQKNLLAL